MIPNILWQTWKTSSVPDSVKPQFDTWRTSNPHLDFKFHSDSECSSFILEHFGEKIYNLFNALPQPIMRADFWRVAVVYVHGGYYADLDLACNSQLDSILPGTTDACFMIERDNVANFFFGATPKHPALALALEYMIREARDTVIKDTQSFGMHSLHQAVRDHYAVTGNAYPNDDNTRTLDIQVLERDGIMKHYVASYNAGPQYDSWRQRDAVMRRERELCDDVLFFTTFNKNGYDLYGKEWIRSFIRTANYYSKVRARVYYEGFVPDIDHPSIEWVDYEQAIPSHKQWKTDYLAKTTHSDYVKTMTVRFSHKAFVIQHALDNVAGGYAIWLDGDCIFKADDYSHFPSSILDGKFLACQVEHAHELNHVESGILIFDIGHPDTQQFNREFKEHYKADNVLLMGQPYDGFLVFKSLLTSGVAYVDLNDGYGKGGIQSDPSMTFCHPAINSKFIHNIGWTGKTQYSDWDSIYARDAIYLKMKSILFGGPSINVDAEIRDKIEHAASTLQSLNQLRPV